jgi:hypothetical protein
MRSGALLFSLKNAPNEAFSSGRFLFMHGGFGGVGDEIRDRSLQLRLEVGGLDLPPTRRSSSTHPSDSLIWRIKMIDLWRRSSSIALRLAFIQN